MPPFQLLVVAPYPIKWQYVKQMPYKAHCGLGQFVGRFFPLAVQNFPGRSLMTGK
jgi:hypothetical protein